MPVPMDFEVTLPWSRLLVAAEWLGEQYVDACPTDDHVCWRNRGLKSYLDRDPIESGCTECWLRFFTNGD